MIAKKRLFLFLLAFNVSVVGLLSSMADPRSQIESIYDKRYKSASALYLYGMNAGYADNFVLTDPNGVTVEMDEFQAAWKNLLGTALKAEWFGQILSFEQLDGSKVRCKVTERFNIITRDKSFERQNLSGTVTLSEDTWELRNGAWVQTHSNVLRHQQAKTGLIKAPDDAEKPKKKQSEKDSI